MEQFITLFYFYLGNLIKYKRFPVFTGIEIETTSICNRRCSFCPNIYRGRGKGFLPDKVFTKIVGDLADMGYDGRVSLHMYGEPLLDKRLPKLLTLLKKRCPHTFVKINTNGDFLKTDILTSLIRAGVDLVYVSQYDGKVNTNVAEVLAWVEKHHPTWRRRIAVRVNNAFFDNRGGLLTHLTVPKKPLNKPCFRPSSTMVINWEGNTVQCCDDYFGKQVMGNVKKHHVLSVWFSKKFNEARHQLWKGNRSQIDICKGCNYTPRAIYNDNTPYEHFHTFGLFGRLFYQSYLSYLTNRMQ
ncbi:radical SAM/SPASM domain-containing protein [Candidatus Gottesmanbacteria bacterium]|nr:radical SAM/SPASM domain-containing protein [Candidatus Gottesmanbacteria bacterium]